MLARNVALGALTIALAGPFAASYAQATPGAALLVEATGSTQPNLAPYSEVAPGETIALGSDATIKFIHYQSCKEVTVTGGVLKVYGPDYQLTGGKLVSEVQQACPQQVKISQSTAIAGGLVLRGALKLTDIMSQPAFVIVGDKANSVTTVKFIDDQTKESFSMPVKDRHVSWSKGSQALKAGDNYQMTLSSNDAALLTVAVRAVPDDQANALIIHAD